jgi:hypothetical protein
MKTNPKATWGKIKNYEKLSYQHKELLKKELCPYYKACTKQAYINDNSPHFLNLDIAGNLYGFRTYVYLRGFYANY